MAKVRFRGKERSFPMSAFQMEPLPEGAPRFQLQVPAWRPLRTLLYTQVSMTRTSNAVFSAHAVQHVLFEIFHGLHTSNDCAAAGSKQRLCHDQRFGGHIQRSGNR